MGDVRQGSVHDPDDMTETRLEMNTPGCHISPADEGSIRASSRAACTNFIHTEFRPAFSASPEPTRQPWQRGMS
jgi:hypothetical protein